MPWVFIGGHKTLKASVGLSQKVQLFFSGCASQNRIAMWVTPKWFNNRFILQFKLQGRLNFQVVNKRTASSRKGRNSLCTNADIKTNAVMGSVLYRTRRPPQFEPIPIPGPGPGPVHRQWRILVSCETYCKKIDPAQSPQKA